MSYVTRVHWFFRLIGAPLVILLLSLMCYPGVVINYWNTRGWTARILLVFMLPLMLVSAIEVFFHRILFDNQVIRERSVFHVGEMRKKYSDLVRVIWKKNENLTLEFSDGRKMKIWWLDGDHEAILKLLRDKSSDDLRVEVK